MIELLPDAIANQIAAGEVIQRPASIVKELLENAIDAGASSIDLHVKNAGKTLVQVSDDGRGMDENDARLCFERHATSKIKTSEDLFSVKTMGFRGEALASIAAVAQVDLKTRHKDQEAGTHILMEGSEIRLQEKCARKVGTTVAVKNLFFNVPARRKFLKSDAVEMKNVQEEFQRIAMAYPELKFRLFHDEKPIYHLPEQSLKQRVIALMGKKYQEFLLPVKEDTEAVNMNGFVAKPEKSKKRRGDQYFFINRRYFRSGYLHHAVRNAFEDMIPSDHQPVYAIFFEMDPELIDINVHPTKQEVKFQDQRMVYNYLRVAIRHALGKFQVTPSIDFDSDPNMFQAKGPSGKGGNFPPDAFSGQRPKGSPEDWDNFFSGGERSDGEVVLGSKMNREGPGEEGALFEEPHFQQPIQIHRSYIVATIQSGLMILDQSLAHQRVLYEEYLRILDEQQVQTQRQLYPTTIEFSAADAHLMDEILPTLKKLGFDIGQFGKNTYILHGLPAMELMNTDPEEMITHLLDDFKNDRDAQLSVEKNVAQMLARSSSIQKGKALSSEEIEHLLGQLFACEEPAIAPNGRPCFIRYSMEDLRKKFRRT